MNGVGPIWPSVLDCAANSKISISRQVDLKINSIMVLGKVMKHF